MGGCRGLGTTFWNSLDKALRTLSHSGRRVWDLSFSHLQDRDVFGSNQSLSKLLYTGGGTIAYGGATIPDTSSGYNTSDLHLIINDMFSRAVGFNDNILTHNNFFSQVWHKTLGGTLPFIFQPDSP